MAYWSERTVPADLGCKRLVVAGKQRLDGSPIGSGKKQPRSTAVVIGIKPWLCELGHPFRVSWSGRVMVIRRSFLPSTKLGVRAAAQDALLQADRCRRSGVYESENCEMTGEQAVQFVPCTSLIEHDPAGGGLDHRQPITAGWRKLIHIIVGRPRELSAGPTTCWVPSCASKGMAMFATNHSTHPSFATLMTSAP